MATSYICITLNIFMAMLFVFVKVIIQANQFIPVLIENSLTFSQFD